MGSQNFAGSLAYASLGCGTSPSCSFKTKESPVSELKEQIPSLRDDSMTDSLLK